MQIYFFKHIFTLYIKINVIEYNPLLGSNCLFRGMDAMVTLREMDGVVTLREMDAWSL